MQLYCMGPSPFSRKVRVAAIELGVADRVHIREQNPYDGSAGFHAINPLARIPALETDEGGVLYDSPVIIDYLNTLAGGTLVPAAGPGRWDALRRQALGDGILDTALPLRAELLRQSQLQSAELVTRLRATVERSLDAADAEPALAHPGEIDVGAIAIACALGWLQFRFPDWDWRGNRPRLATWFDTLMARPSFQSTMPK